MYVCIYIYMYTYVHIYKKQLSAFKYMYAYMRIFIYIHMYVYILYMYIPMFIYAYMYIAAKDPNQPKKPLSAFMIFSNSIREKVRKDDPGSRDFLLIHIMLSFSTSKNILF